MADKPPQIGETVFPAVEYDEAPAAIAFLKEAFGFKPGLVAPGPENAVAPAEPAVPAGGVMLGHKLPPDPENVRAAAPFGVYVVVEDAEAHFARAQEADAKIARRSPTRFTARANIPRSTTRAINGLAGPTGRTARPAGFCVQPASTIRRQAGLRHRELRPNAP